MHGQRALRSRTGSGMTSWTEHKRDTGGNTQVRHKHAATHLCPVSQRGSQVLLPVALCPISTQQHTLLLLPTELIPAPTLA